MSIDIFIRNELDYGETVIINGGIPSMADMVDGIAAGVEAKYPHIFEKAFGSLDWDEVHLDELNKEEFNLVFSISEVKFEKFLAMFPTIELRESEGARWANWQNYMNAMRSDPRIKDVH